MEEEIHEPPWVARSPDINPIENVWGTLVRTVYRGGRQFDTPEDLNKFVLHEWEKLSMDDVRSVISSIPRRIWALHDA